MSEETELRQRQKEEGVMRIKESERELKRETQDYKGKKGKVRQKRKMERRNKRETKENKGKERI